MSFPSRCVHSAAGPDCKGAGGRCWPGPAGGTPFNIPLYGACLRFRDATLRPTQEYPMRYMCLWWHARRNGQHQDNEPEAGPWEYGAIQQLLKLT
eukprot:2543236-Amphidinium_carterae.2